MAINDPRDIPGLVLWLSAEAEASNYTNDQEMTGWTDLSGNGNNATGGSTGGGTAGTHNPYWQATSGPNGGAAIRFGAGGGATGETGAYFSLPSALLSGAASGEVMATVRAEFDNTTSVGNWLKAGSSTSANHYPYQTTIYDDFGTTARKTIGTQTGLGQWHRVNVWSAANDYGYYFDGASKYATTTNTVGWSTAPRLGNSGASGPSNQTQDTWEGYLGCVVAYSRKLTAAERADLDAWLQAHPNGGTVSSAPALTLSGTAPAVTGAFDLSALPAVELVGTTPTVTGSFDVAVAIKDVTGDLTANAPKVTGSFSVEQSGVTTADLSGAVPGVFGTFNATASAPPLEAVTDSVNRANGMTLVTEWDVSVEPPVVTAKRQRGHDRVVVTSLPDRTLVDGRPV